MVIAKQNDRITVKKLGN